MKWTIIFIAPFLLFVTQAASAQEKKEKKEIVLKGFVKTADNKPVANAFIFIDGEIVDARTRTNGKFRIKIPESSEKLAIYTIDERFAEAGITGMNDLNIILPEPQGTDNPETVSSAREEVDMGYYKSQADKLTSSIGIVKAKRGEENYYNDIYEMIKGELPGVTVAGKSITIRGPGSLQSSNEPLFVVDGTPVNSVSHIVPANVESVSVLKGASANMYGARGSNGVIVIKLKSGKQKE